jgi:hypothetical protein
MPLSRVSSLRVRLERIEYLARDLAHEISRTGATESQASRDVADAIRVEIAVVIRALQKRTPRIRQ